MISELGKTIVCVLCLIGSTTILAVMAVAIYFRPIANVSMIHCAGMIAKEAELIKGWGELQLALKDMEQREIDLEADRQSLPVCKKKK